MMMSLYVYCHISISDDDGIADQVLSIIVMVFVMLMIYNSGTATTLYLYSIDYDNYGIVIAGGDIDSNDVAKSDNSYDYYICTNDDDDYEILTAECNISVKINASEQMIKQ